MMFPSITFIGVGEGKLFSKETCVDPIRHLKISFIILGLLVSLGVAGYMGIEGWKFLDSLYMTVITLSTVGFREVMT
jgi:hypothetical protein